MRVIIEVDNEQELKETLALLGERNVVVIETPGEAAIKREVLLREVAGKYHGKLPENWKFNRDEAHGR